MTDLNVQPAVCRAPLRRGSGQPNAPVYDGLVWIRGECWKVAIWDNGEKGVSLKLEERKGLPPMA